LQRELDNFVETDEIVKRNLDRKDKVNLIRNKVDDVIKKSIVDLASKSPNKEARGHNLRSRSPTDRYQSSQYQGGQTQY
jgi:hypothetical protein